jgi:hypothetical protein
MTVKKEPAVQLNLNALAFNLQNVSLRERDCIAPGKPGKENNLNFIVYQDSCIHRTCFHNIHAVP